MPSFSICPYNLDNSSVVKLDRSYTAEDVEKLPSLMEVIDIELLIYGAGIIGNVE